MNRIKSASITAAVIAATGCASPVPVATNFEQTTQKVARTAHHWDVVADDVIAQTATSISRLPALQNRPLYVVQNETGSAFDAAFRNFLTTRLVAAGASVNVCRAEPERKTGFIVPGDPTPVEVNYETQIIQHRGRMPEYTTGALTFLAGDIGAIYNISEVGHHRDLKTALGVGLIALNDIAAGHLSRPTHTELILTTTIVENNKYLMRKSDVYYIPDADVELFARRVARASLCPTDRKQLATYAERDASQAEDAKRYRMISASLRRVNPDWRAPDPD